MLDYMALILATGQGCPVMVAIMPESGWCVPLYPRRIKAYTSVVFLLQVPVKYYFHHKPVV